MGKGGPGQRSVLRDTAMARGVLIALEGIDGVGKSTQAKLLSAWVQGLGREVVSTREPTSGPFGTKIRESRFKARLPPLEELVLK